MSEDLIDPFELAYISAKVEADLLIDQHLKDWGKQTLLAQTQVVNLLLDLKAILNG